MVITSLDQISFNKTYQIEVIDKKNFEGAFEDDSVFTECSPEVQVTGSVDFSFDIEDEEFDDYEDIPDENIVVVNQSDIDNGYVVVKELPE